MGGLGKVKWCLLGVLISVLVLLASSILVPGGLTNVIKRVANSDVATQLRALSRREAIPERGLIEMVVEEVGVSRADYQPVVILKQKEGNIRLPIWIGPAEAGAIAVVLERGGVGRPLTSDLLCSIIGETGASLDYVVIDELQDSTFYATIIVKANWTKREIDARPSDAIAIALRVRAPIYVEKAVLDKAGI